MRDPKRIQKIATRLSVLWHHMPDMRLGQMMSFIEDEVDSGDPFYIEDNEWSAAIERLIEKEQERIFSTKSITGG